MKKIAITMGDPAGVGPELCLRLLTHLKNDPQTKPIIYGNAHILCKVAGILDLPLPDKEHINHIEIPNVESILPGKESAISGEASYQYLKTAIEDALSNNISAICTAPINKKTLHLAGIDYPGHTEILTELTQSKKTCMLQVSEELTASFVTVHVGYHEVPSLLTQERILEVIQLTNNAISKIKQITNPRLVACGLNPHAGEDGLFGNSEEETIIQPAIKKAQDLGLTIEGPLPPDTVFIPAKRKTTDAVICMYHDQGHIPLKALAFDSAVNITLGLPIIRTSVDHGTAYDIAWQGKANPGSIIQAYQLANLLSNE